MTRRKITIELEILTEFTLYEQQEFIDSAIRNYVKPLFHHVKIKKINNEPIKE